MVLESVTLRGFQSFRTQQLIEFDPHLTLLAGQNNVGKSALLRALQVHHVAQEGIADDFCLTYRWLLDTSEMLDRFAPSSAESTAVRDWISSGGPQQTLVASFVRPNGNGEVSPEALHCARIELPQLDAFADREPGRTSGWDSGMLTGNVLGVDALVGLASDAARRVVYLGPRRVEQGTRQLGRSAALEPDARNLAEVLLYLYMERRFDTFAKVENLMRSAFPGVRGIGVGGDRQFSPSHLAGEPQIYFEGRDRPVPLRLCGTGLEQMLALAVAVFSVDDDRILLIDEPQAYLHPHAERAVLALLRASTERQFIVASHSHTLLGGQSLRHARLLTWRDGGTCVAQIADEQQALDELGVTAADLWLVDRLLWVEGATEEKVLTLLANETLTESERSTLAIRRMPDTSRFAARSRRQADATYRFCNEIVAAISPMPVRMKFLFDADEKSPQFREQVLSASGQRATFLEVRELENLFLDDELIACCIAEMCEITDDNPPERTQIAALLAEALEAYDDKDVYPRGRPDAGDEPRAVVRGSRVLQRVWYGAMNREYDKVRDGERLTRLALKRNPRLLEPLLNLLTGLA